MGKKLVWKWSDKPIMGGAHAKEARAASGVYKISPIFKIETAGISHYIAEYYADRKKVREPPRHVGLFPTIEAAMAASQRDHDGK
jgi:hypothetical protein